MKKNRPRFVWYLIVITTLSLIFLISMTGLYIIEGGGGIFFPLPIPYRSLSPFKGKVIDTDTKEPIQGAVVLAVYYFTSSGVAGAISSVEDGQETLTDKNGEFELPRTRRWFVLHRGYPEGTLEIFKPGYGTFWDKRAKAVGDNKSWPTPGKYIVYELPRLKTTKELKAQNIRTYSEIPYRYKKNYIRLYNEWRISLGYGPTKLIPK
jgi:hypothetical protein